MSTLLVMACSAAKNPDAAPAIELYQGAMFNVYRKHVGNVRPDIVILSAEHGFVHSEQLLQPYDRAMDQVRSDAMFSNIARFDRFAWPDGDTVLLAGGELYRRVMRRALARQQIMGNVSHDADIAETVGGIGYQRSQLGEWLRSHT